MLFEDLPVVESASFHTQNLAQAPANVTVITGEEIRKYGYRTLGEALDSARGFYITHDRTYAYVGLRGFLTPGDYNTRFLLMLNGHYMTDNIYSSNNYFGQDFPLDMDLVERIEIVRGTGSALYGTNGIFCIINVVTKSPVDHPRARVSTEVGSFGQKKLQASSAVDLGRGANLLWSMSVFNNAGQSLYFPEFDAPETNHGWARGVDGERGYHAFANLVWRRWSFTGLLGSREKNAPFLSWTPTMFGARGTKVLDRRGFVEATYRRELKGGELRWRLYYDHYKWWGRYDREDETGVTDTRDLGLGNWAGTQLSYSLPARVFGSLTLGTELAADADAIQRTELVSPIYQRLIDLNTPRRMFAAFAQDELDLSRRWKAYLGIRFDRNLGHWNFVSPRLALIFEQSPATVWKFLYGRAFRSPSLCEAYYEELGGAQLANPSLQPERAHNFEVTLEKKLGRRMNAVASAYLLLIHDFINTQMLPDGNFQYQNRGSYGAEGLELEINGRLWKRLESGASFALQQTRDLMDALPVPNSPAQVGKLRLGIPLLRDRVWLTGTGSWLSSRSTFAGDTLAGLPLVGATVTTQGLAANWDLQFGVRNLLDRRYYDPASGPVALDRVLADGRSIYLKLIWRTRE